MVFFEFKPNFAASFLRTVQTRGLNVVFAVTSAAGVSAIVAAALINDVVAVAAVVDDSGMRLVSLLDAHQLK